MQPSNSVSSPFQQPLDKTQIYFVGGPRDGEILYHDKRETAVTAGDCVMWQTGGGQLGAEFYTVSEYIRSQLVGVPCEHWPAVLGSGFVPISHRYEITVRWIRQDTLCLRLTYRGVFQG